MDTSVIALVAVGAALAVYQFAKYRLSQMVHPIRLELVDLVAEISDDETVPPRIKAALETILDNLLSNWAAWSLALRILPSALFRRKERQDIVDMMKRIPESKRRRILYVYRAGTLCVLANSPFAALLFLAQGFLIQVLAASIGKTALYVTSTLRPVTHTVTVPSVSEPVTSTGSHPARPFTIRLRRSRHG